MKKICLLLFLMFLGMSSFSQIHNTPKICQNLKQQYIYLRELYFSDRLSNTWGDIFVKLLKKFSAQDNALAKSCMVETAFAAKPGEIILGLLNNANSINKYLKKRDLNWRNVRDEQYRDSIKTKKIIINIYMLEENLWYLYPI